MKALGDIKELLSEAWAMEPARLQAFAERMAQFDDAAVIAAMDRAARDSELSASRGMSRARDATIKPYEMRGDAAVIRVSGVLMRNVPRWYAWYGIDATSTTELRDAIASAASDSAVKSIVLAIDSPGGQAQGVLDVADAVFAARQRKPVDALVETLAASGAYWIASQAKSVSAPADALLGSIGCYMVVADWSKAAEKFGVKVNVVRSGPHKGAGVMGAPVTDDQLASIQGLVNGFADMFREGVARGRGLTQEQAASVATGEVWLASESRNRGLVDRVEQVSQAMSRLAPQEKVMTQEEVEKAKAEARAEAIAAEKKRVADIIAAFPDHSKFASEQIAKGATLEQALVSHREVLKAELEQERKAKTVALEEAKSAKSAAAAAPPAASPLPRGGDPSASSGRDFMSAAREYATRAGCSMTIAMAQVARTEPALHEAFCESQPRISLSRKPKRVGADAE